MKWLHKPYWLLVTVSVPQLLIFWIFWKIYSIIHPQLDKNSQTAWLVFGITLGFLWLAFTLYGAAGMLLKKNTLPFISLLLFSTYIPFLYLFYLKLSTLIPSDIPRWMFFGFEPEICVLTLIMPALVHAMLLLVLWLTPGEEKYKAMRDVLFVVAIPLFWYAVYTAILPLIRVPNQESMQHAFFTLFILSTLCFLFFLTRLIFVQLQRKPQIWQKGMIPFVLILPSLGLIINNTTFHPFGDFSHPLFYALALVTGALLVLPPFENKGLRMAVFAAKSMMLVYTFYFFIVFLPYLPLAIPAIIIFGTGFLMLTPFVLGLAHIRSLWYDYGYLTGYYGKQLPIWGFILGLSILPLALTLTVARDKENLDSALRFVYQRGYAESAEVKTDTAAVERVLKNIRKNKDNGRGMGMGGNKTPYITAFYNWLVLENVTLSKEKLDKMESIFLGKASGEAVNTRSAGTPAAAGVRISDCSVETEYDPVHSYYKSWIHLDLTNETDTQREYVTSFDLPEGCFISNYYLFVNNEKKFGMIADKRAANWIYQQIVNVKRDPGILYYLEDHRMMLKVFPFTSKELRKTGFEIIHKGDAVFDIDGKQIKLSGKANSEAKIVELGRDLAFIPAALKEKLPEADRNPRYFVIIDHSEKSKGKTGDYFSSMEKFLENNRMEDAKVEVIAANFNERPVKPDGNWQRELEKFPAQGGFFLERVIKRILYHNYKSRSEEYPVFIVVTDHYSDAVMTEDFHGLKFMPPESEYFYQLTSGGEVSRHSLTDSGSSRPVTGITATAAKRVVVWRDADLQAFYLPDDGRDTVVMKNDGYNMDTPILKGDLWQYGLALQGMSLSMQFHPEKYYEKSLIAIKASISTGIMAPVTSYIVLENAAQEKALLEKQKQILSSNPSLDVGEQTQMSEPPLWAMALAISAVACIMRYRRRRFNLPVKNRV